MKEREAGKNTRETPALTGHGNIENINNGHKLLFTKNISIKSLSTNKFRRVLTANLYLLKHDQCSCRMLRSPCTGPQPKEDGT